MHELAAGQDTQKSWPVGITGFGVGVTDQPPGAEAPAGTEARAGETVSSPPGMPSIAPSATITPSRFMATPPSPALARSAPRRRGLPVGLRWSWSIGPGPHSDLKCARMRLSEQSQCAFSDRCVRRTVSHNAWLRGGAAAVIDYRLLGPIEAGVDGRMLDIAGHKQLALLAVLVLRANQPVTRDVLVDWLWGEHPPPGVQHTLDVHISRLRKTLETAVGQPVVLTRPGAYLLRAAADS